MEQNNNTLLTSAVAETNSQSTETNQTTGASSNVEKAFIFNDLLDSTGKFNKDWTKSLPSELKDNKSLEKFNSPTQLMTSYLSLEKEFSKRQNEKITVPGEDATEEQWNDFKKKIGAEFKPEDYGLEKPENAKEWNQALADGAKTIASKYGIPKKALNELVGLYQNNMNEMIGQSEKMSLENKQTVLKEMKKEWGDSFNTNISKALKAASAIGLDPNKPEIGDNPEIIKALVNVASLLGDEKGLVKGDVNSESIKDKYDKVLKSDDYLGKNGIQAQLSAANLLKNLHKAMNG